MNEVVSQRTIDNFIESRSISFETIYVLSMYFRKLLSSLINFFPLFLEITSLDSNYKRTWYYINSNC